MLKAIKLFQLQKATQFCFLLKLRPNSFLTVEHWVGDSLVSVEQFLISDSVFNYKMVPVTGDNKLVFKLTDKFNNSTSTDVFITREKDVIQQPLIRPEYSRIIAQKQIAALTAVLKSRASDKLKKVIEDANIEKQQFGKVDDLISYLKEESAKKSISPEELDKLALKVAVMDNILTQAAVDLMAKYTDGELKDILGSLDIYKSNLKTWTDLQEYLASITSLNISPEELNKIAAAILTDVDPSISVIREKILTYSESSENGSLLRQSVATADISNIKLAGKWLQMFINESLKLGLTHYQMADILAVISSLPDTKTEQFLSDLINQSNEPLLSSLNTLDLKKEKIKTPKDLLRFLLTKKEEVNFPEEAIYKSIANLVSTQDITDDIITAQLTPVEENRLWFLWVILGAGLIFLLFIILKRKKKKDK